MVSPSIEIKIVENEDKYCYGNVTDDPLGHVFYSDEWVHDCPEDLTLGRDIGSLISHVNELRRALHRLDPSHPLLTLGSPRE